MIYVSVSDSKAFILVTVLAQTHTAPDHISTKMHKKKPTLCQREKQNRKVLNSHCVDIVKQSVGFVWGGKCLHASCSARKHGAK